MVTMGLSRDVSEIDGDFMGKSQFFTAARVFYAPAEGIPLGIGYRRKGSQTKMMRYQQSFELSKNS